MNRETLIQLIDHPEQIAREHLGELEAVAAGYPWFFGPRQLQLFYHKKYNDIHFEDYLQKWSLLCPGPAHLYQFLNPSANKNTPSEEVAVASENLTHTIEQEVTNVSNEIRSEVTPETAPLPATEASPLSPPEAEPLPLTAQDPDPQLDSVSVSEHVAEIPQEVPQTTIEENHIPESDTVTSVPEIPKPVSESPSEKTDIPQAEQKIHEPEIIPPVIISPEPVTPVSEEKVKLKEESDMITGPQKQETPPAQTESWADIMLKKVAEIKKKKEEEALAKAKLQQSTSAIITEPVANPAFIPQTETSPLTAQDTTQENQPVRNQLAEDPIINDNNAVIQNSDLPASDDISEPLSVVHSDRTEASSDAVLPAEKIMDNKEVYDPDLSARISELLTNAGTLLNKENDTSSNTEQTKPEPIVEQPIAEEKEELPFELYVPVYDLSSLEKEAERNNTGDFSQKKMDFFGWLDLMNRQIEEKKPEKDKHSEIIDRFIQEKPRIIIRHNEASFPPVSPPAEDEPDASVCSETLADILVMQKKYSEAEEMYKKLSLLYPEKSVYFAAQIEKIRNNQV